MLVIKGEKVPTISDAASALGVDVRTLRRWIRDEILPNPPVVAHGKRKVAIFPSAYISRAKATLSIKRSKILPQHVPRENRGPARIFVSYSHKDKRWLEDLKSVMRTFVRDNQLDIWDDSRIPPGAGWRSEIEAALKVSDAAILLISRHFLASDFIVERELLPILRAAKRRGLRVWWIAVSAIMYEDSQLSEFQALNEPDHPLNSVATAKRDRQWVEIARKIKIAINRAVDA